jgi:hypothetical protein
MIRAAALLVAAASAGAVSAQFPNPNPNTPPGLQGRDWDAVSFRVVGNHVAVVTAVNVTQIGGARSSFKIYLDGALIDEHSANERWTAEVYFVPREGLHNVLVVCDNDGATAQSCRVSAMRADEGDAF